MLERVCTRTRLYSVLCRQRRLPASLCCRSIQREVHPEKKIDLCCGNHSIAAAWIGLTLCRNFSSGFHQELYRGRMLGSVGLPGAKSPHAPKLVLQQAITATTCAFTIELSQLDHASWIDSLRRIMLGRVVLGFYFTAIGPRSLYGWHFVLCRARICAETQYSDQYAVISQ